MSNDKDLMIKTLNQEQQDKAIEMAAKGRSLRDIIGFLGISNWFFAKFKQDTLDFADKFGLARSEGLELLADDLIGIADDLSLDVQRTRLKSDNIKWILSKRKADTYGDRIDVNVNKTVDISIALKEARARIKDVTPKLSDSPARGGVYDSQVLDTDEIVEPDIFD